MNKFIDFLRKWTLPIAMVVGAASYFIFTALPWPDGTYHLAEEAARAERKQPQKRHL